ncbi:MAG: hypothetical protein ACREQH_03500 [Candidatus Binatus sp.]
MKKGSFRFAMIAVGLAVMLAMPAGPLAEYAAAQTQPATTQVPQPQANDVNWPGAGYGAGALVCNLLYIPAKMVYAILGGIIGGGTYLVTAGNLQAANTVWRSALGGDYVVTPQMLAGQQPLNFSGPTDTPPNVTAPENSPTVGATTTTTTTASSGSVAPITPLPPSGPSATASSSAGGQPLDHGAGPAPGSAGGSNIE